MKRAVLAVGGTAAGLVAMLGFKTGHPLQNAGPLPSVGAPDATSGVAGSSASGASGGASRSYLGRAVTTRYGVVQVRVTASGHRITGVAFARLSAYDPHSQQIDTQAGPRLLTETLTAQSAHVNSVSGASYTSAGYKTSLQSALDSAGI